MFIRYLYRVKRLNGSSQDYEEYALNEATEDFTNNGVSMTKLRLYYTLNGDPESR